MFGTVVTVCGERPRAVVGRFGERLKTSFSSRMVSSPAWGAHVTCTCPTRMRSSSDSAVVPFYRSLHFTRRLTGSYSRTLGISRLERHVGKFSRDSLAPVGDGVDFAFLFFFFFLRPEREGLLRFFYCQQERVFSMVKPRKGNVR